MRYFYQSNNDSFGSGFKQLARILSVLSNGDSVQIDFSNVNFLNPVDLLPIVILAKNSKYSGQVSIENLTSEVKGYVNTIRFPDALDTANMDISQVNEVLNQFIDKTYIPIVCFSGKVAEKRDPVLTLLNKLISNKTNRSTNAPNVLISELTDNIEQHANTNTGFIVAQFYKKGIIDICIGDSGDGIAKPFNNLGMNVDYRQAIDWAVNGKSTKDFQIGRGYGLSGSINLLNDSGGQFLIHSGDSTFIQRNKGQGRIVTYPGNTWEGTLVLLRINTKIVSSLKVLNYYT